MGQGGHVDVDHGELTATAGLFLVLAFDVLRGALDGLEVRDLRRQQLDFHAHAVQSIDDDLHVDLPRAAEQDLLRLRIVADLDGHVGVDDFVQLDRHFVLVALALGVQCIGDEGRGDLGITRSFA